MKIILEGNSFTRCPITFTEYDQFTVNINGKDLHFQMMYSKRNTDIGTGWELPKVTWYIEGEQIQQLKVKTPEEKAAEESVAKAKEALEAAELTLKVIKEKK